MPNALMRTVGNMVHYDDIVSVYVGEAKTLFQLHQSVLTRHSKLFSAAFNGTFHEATTKCIHLPEVEDLEIFRRYVHWMYSGDIITMGPDEVQSRGFSPKQQERLARLYFLADHLENAYLRNAVMTMLVDLYNAGAFSLSEIAIATVFEETPENSQPRKFAFDSALAYGYLPMRTAEQFCRVHYPRFPDEFYRILAQVAARHGDSFVISPSDRGRCFYHEHGEVPKCEPVREGA